MAKSFSPRIEKLVSLTDPKLPTWDLCCDHGQIGIAAHLRGSDPIYFVDQVDHILKSLRFTIQQNYLGDSTKFEESFSFQCQNILELPQIVDANIVLAGVGTPLVKEFLETQNHLSSCNVILGPQNKPEELKDFLTSHFETVNSFEVQEKKRTRFLFLIKRLTDE